MNDTEEDQIDLKGFPDEKTLRESEVPWPKSMEELTAYINSLVERPHDYGTCVYAMSMSALAAFYYVSSKLGVTGFQAGCADMDFLKRSRHWNCPFIILKGEDAAYPQHDLPARLAEAMEEWKPWLKKFAQARLAEAGSAHPDVKAHWEKLAAFEPKA